MRDHRIITTGLVRVLLATIFLFARAQLSGAQAPTPVPASGALDCFQYLLNTPLTADLLKPGMLQPCAPAVNDKALENVFADPVDRLQHGFDLYSWLTFAALNSPVDGTTRIGRGPGKGGDAPAFWESYKQLPDVMLADASKPSAWGEPAKIPDECGGGVVKPGTMVVHIEEETFNQPFKSGPLIDQNGNYALFVILMNKQMFQYIVDNGLYSKAGQKVFAEKQTPSSEGVNFPLGSNRQATVGLGAVMVKASWKVLGASDDAAKFHTINGLIYTPAKENPKTAATCVPQTLGLIGFHVGHKAEFNTQWVWTTFEHVANAPEQRDVDGGRKLLDHYNFYDPKCDPVKCPVNQIPPTPWNPGIQPFPGGYRSQITRTIPLTDDATKINDLSRAVEGIKGTVWENYFLVSTQWPTDSANPIDLSGIPAPTYLANTTLETYSQGNFPLASSSCIACHLNATTASPSPISSDFTYILEKAR